MKIAAIYARKSTDQTGIAEDSKSVSRQVENARAFVVQQGWTVDDRFVFIDDGVSGAAFKRRPGFVSLMDALRPKPWFQVLLISEESRLGCSTDEVPYAIGRLVKAGVEVWCYRDQHKVALDTPMDKFMVSATSFASDMERWLGQQRTTEAMLRKARAGHVTGGKVFGYDNVPVDGHVERHVNLSEAAVVKDICTRYAAGEGFKQIAHGLNAKKLPSPRPQNGRPAGWDQSSVRAVLKRSIYRGTIIYNRTTKRDHAKKMVGARLRRQQVAYARSRGLSGRRACAVLVVARSTLGYQSRLVARDALPLAAMRRLAAQYPRYGYRRIRIFLKREGHAMSPDRTHRLWRQAGLQVPRRRPRRRVAIGRPRPLPASAANHVWAYDFLFDTCANGQTLKCLTVVDEWTRECLAIDVAGGIRSGRVIEVLTQLLSVHGAPRYLRSDNGPTAAATRAGNRGRTSHSGSSSTRHRSGSSTRISLRR